MATLIVGGTGSIGGYVALRLREQGEAVTLAARRAPDPVSPIASFPLLIGDFTRGDFTPDRLEGFDTLIFAAANDWRQLPPGARRAEQDAFYMRVNGEAVPAFFAAARQAGIARAAYVGSYYPQARPELVARYAYVRSRLAADEGVRALADDRFKVVSLNAPIIVGGEPGMVRERHRLLARMALGIEPDIPLFAPVGGSNHMSIHSLCQAIIGGLERGENGRGYLVGDINLLFADYLRLYYEAAGRGDIDIPVEAAVHPVLGGAWPPPDEPPVFFEPEAADTLGYDRNDISRTVAQTVELVRAAPDLVGTA